MMKINRSAKVVNGTYGDTFQYKLEVVAEEGDNPDYSVALLLELDAVVDEFANPQTPEIPPVEEPDNDISKED